jgi:hypothetical protein
LYVNFFNPFSSSATKNDCRKLIRKYDTARTPYQRVLERAEFPLTRKAHLLNLYLPLNPVALRQRIDQKILQLWSTLWLRNPEPYSW